MNAEYLITQTETWGLVQKRAMKYVGTAPTGHLRGRETGDVKSLQIDDIVASGRCTQCGENKSYFTNRCMKLRENDDWCRYSRVHAIKRNKG
jgi:hypothetical protein